MYIAHNPVGTLFKTPSTGDRYHFKLLKLSCGPKPSPIYLKQSLKIVCQRFLAGNFSGMGLPIVVK